MPFKQRQPEAAVAIEKAYLLNDDIADIDIEAEKMISFDGTKESKTSLRMEK